MAKINLFYRSHVLYVTLFRNHEKNIIVVTNVKKKLLMHIPNYKLNRIIDKTYRPFNVLSRTDKT